MVDRKYEFRYRGIAPETPTEPIRRIESGLTVIDLYRKMNRFGIWWVEVDFPPLLQPLEQTRPCSSFFDLLAILEESEAIERFKSGQRKLGDDLLMFGRELRDLSVEEPDICQGERVLRFRRWDYDAMMILMGSRNPLPLYTCDQCHQEPDFADEYSDMVVGAIVYITDRASDFIGNNLAYTEHLRRFFPEDLDKIFAS